MRLNIYLLIDTDSDPGGQIWNFDTEYQLYFHPHTYTSNPNPNPNPNP